MKRSYSTDILRRLLNLQKFQTAGDLTTSQADLKYPPLRSSELLNLSTRRTGEVS